MPRSFKTWLKDALDEKPPESQPHQQNYAQTPYLTPQWNPYSFPQQQYPGYSPPPQQYGQQVFFQPPYGAIPYGQAPPNQPQAFQWTGQAQYNYSQPHHIQPAYADGRSTLTSTSSPSGPVEMHAPHSPPLPSPGPFELHAPRSPPLPPPAPQDARPPSTPSLDLNNHLNNRISPPAISENQAFLVPPPIPPRRATPVSLASPSAASQPEIAQPRQSLVPPPIPLRRPTPVSVPDLGPSSPPRPLPNTYNSFSGDGQQTRVTRDLEPQSVPEASAPLTIRKILSLDGGGVRGLSEILILKYMMQQVGRQRGFPPNKHLEPWQEFDMICGTSTGGLLAIMLGRLRMSLRECEAAYLSLSLKIFTSTRHKANVPGRTYDFLKANGKFQSAPLEEEIQKILHDRGLDKDQLLWEDDTPEVCRVFVCAVRENGTPTQIRSYHNPDEYDDLLEECQIWQAARATSAASTFFDPITIGRYEQKFVDGALIYNNPIELANLESERMWPDDDRMIISLGTGIEPPSKVTGNALELVKTLTKLVTDTEERNVMFQNQHRAMSKTGRLYRFNVEQGLGSLGLEEHEAKAAIAEFTAKYLRQPWIMQSIEQCAHVMKEGGQRLRYIAGEGTSHARHT